MNPAHVKSLCLALSLSQKPKKITKKQFGPFQAPSDFVSKTRPDRRTTMRSETQTQTGTVSRSWQPPKWTWAQGYSKDQDGKKKSKTAAVVGEFGGICCLRTDVQSCISGRREECLPQRGVQMDSPQGLCSLSHLDRASRIKPLRLAFSTCCFLFCY